MNKVSPAERRVSLQLGAEIAAIGIGYIPVPYEDNDERAKLLNQSIDRLEELAVQAEEEERNVKR